MTTLEPQPKAKDHRDRESQSPIMADTASIADTLSELTLDQKIALLAGSLATWDRQLLREAGELLGHECISKGAHCWLGPTSISSAHLSAVVVMSLSQKIRT